MLRSIFYLSILVLLYTYFGYPILLAILMKFKREKPIVKRNITPKVSIVISAYNEEETIAEKLYNLLSLNYPRKNMEVVVVSDASTDEMDEIVKGFADQGVKLHRLRQRSGKIAAYRRVLPLLQGEIIVFSDATSYLHKDSIRYLISNFNDPTIGCVGALLEYTNPEDAIVGEGEDKYWEYEKKVKEYESNLCSLTSISGTLYAVRKDLYPCNIKDDLADDLIVPLQIKKRGFRTVLEPKAICKEFTTLSVKEDMAKRIRITIQNIRGLIDQAEILNPFRYGLYSLLVTSHKLLRLLVPAFLLIIFISNAILAYGSWIYSLIFISQIMFYLVGFVGYFMNGRVRLKLINTVFYFCLSNLAILVGIIEFFKGKKMATWEPIRA